MAMTSPPRIALVGASGWVGRNLGPALLAKGVCSPQGLVCVNRSGRSDAYAEWPETRWETDPETAIADVHVVILSIRPQDFRAVELPCEGRLVLSLMAGVPSREVAERTGAGRIVRAMPNAAVEIGRCYAPWHATGPVTEEDRRLVGMMLDSVGSSDEVEREHDVDVLSALSGTGHAYPALLAGALLAAARAQGLSELVAVRAVEAIVCDAAQLLRRRVADTEAVIDQFMGYAGVTAAALEAARAAGFEGAVDRAVKAGVERAASPDW
jgi:pyrroline-5-carboxylate reductase